MQSAGVPPVYIWLELECFDFFWCQFLESISNFSLDWKTVILGGAIALNHVGWSFTPRMLDVANCFRVCVFLLRAKGEFFRLCFGVFLTLSLSSVFFHYFSPAIITLLDSCRFVTWQRPMVGGCWTPSLSLSLCGLKIAWAPLTRAGVPPALPTSPPPIHDHDQGRGQPIPWHGGGSSPAAISLFHSQQPF